MRIHLIISTLLTMGIVLLLTGCIEGYVTGQDAPPSNCTNFYGQEFWKYASTADVEAALDRGTNVNARDENGNTPLHIVARYNREPAQVDLLLENGADVNAKNYNEITPLNFAVTELLLGVREVPHPDLEVIALLLERGADPNAEGYSCYEHANGRQYKRSTTALHSAIDSNLDVSIVEMLLKYGADPNLPNSGLFPLHEAVANGSVDIVELFLKYGADPNAEDNDGRTPLLSALQENYATASASVVVMTLLEYGADPNIASSPGKRVTPLYVAVDKNLDQEVIEILLESGANLYEPLNVHFDFENETPLHAAARNPNLDVITFLLDRGADVNAAYLGHRIEGPYVDQTPLHSAVRYNSNPDVVMLLLDRGADLTAKDLIGRTPLHWAVQNTIPLMTELLLDHGSDINVKDRQGWTPLHLATYEQNTVLVRLLLQKGADPNLASNRGSIALHIAAQRSIDLMIITLLIDYGANMDAKDNDGNDSCRISKDEDRPLEIRHFLCQ